MNMIDQRNARDAGFTRVMDPQAAQRQLHASAAVAAIFGLAAVIVLSTTHVTPAAPSQQQVRLTVQAPQMVLVQQASVSVQSGG